MMITNSNKHVELQKTTSKSEIKKTLLAQMQEQLSIQQEILSKSAGRSSCCIHKIPGDIKNVNNGRYANSFRLQIISIGPYHHGYKSLKMFEMHKWGFLSLLLDRIKNITLEDLLKAVRPLESRARECYSETLRFDQDEFIKILVLDGCFVIELLRKLEGVVQFEKDDPLKIMAPYISLLLRDLIRLENQIPFFVLDCLFELTKMPGEEKFTLATLALKFFDRSVLKRPEPFIHKKEPDHILDLLRSSFILPDHNSSTHAVREEGEGGSKVNEGGSTVLEKGEPRMMCLPKKTKKTMMCMKEETSMWIGEEKTDAKGSQVAQNNHLISCVSKLQRAGISVKKSIQGDSFLSVNFCAGVINMPAITLDDIMREFLMNCIMYERYHHDSLSKQITTYALFLDSLVNTHRDVEYLSEQNVIENYMGSDKEAANFINCLTKHVSFDTSQCYLTSFFEQVNKYYDNKCHVRVAEFKDTYFSSPWSFISAMAAFILLVLTVISTVYSVLAYNKT